MKKIILFIVVILILGWAIQNFTGLKVFDYAKNYWGKINWAELKNFKLQSLFVPTATPIPGKQLNIFIRDVGFVPNNSGLEAGGKVTWYNEDARIHNVVGDGWESGELKPSRIFSKVFETPGVYNYHCSVHPEMTGKITTY